MRVALSISNQTIGLANETGERSRGVARPLQELPIRRLDGRQIAVAEIADGLEGCGRLAMEHRPEGRQSFLERHAGPQQSYDVDIVLGLGAIEYRLELGGKQIEGRGDAQDAVSCEPRLTDAPVARPPKKESFTSPDGRRTDTTKVFGSSWRTAASARNGRFSRSPSLFKATSEKKSKSIDCRCPICKAMAVPPYSTKPRETEGASKLQSSLCAAGRVSSLGANSAGIGKRSCRRMVGNFGP